MKTKNNRKTQRILNLLLLLALLVPMLACGDSSTPAANTPPANRPAPNTELTEEKPKETKSSTPSDPLAAFYGSWEMNRGSGVEKWNFTKASNRGNDYVGRVTDTKNKDIYEYTIVNPDSGKPGSGTIRMMDLSGAPFSLTGKTIDYEVTDNGNKITLKDKPEIVLKRDSGSADLKEIAEKISGYSWTLNSAGASALGLTGECYVKFSNPPQSYSTGYGGTMTFEEKGPSRTIDVRDYIITSKTEVTLKDGVGEKLATYELVSDDLLVIKYKSEPGVLTLTK